MTIYVGVCSDAGDSLSSREGPGIRCSVWVGCATPHMDCSRALCCCSLACINCLRTGWTVAERTEGLSGVPFGILRTIPKSVKVHPTEDVLYTFTAPADRTLFYVYVKPTNIQASSSTKLQSKRVAELLSESRNTDRVSSLTRPYSRPPQRIADYTGLRC
eukprot:1196248-Prorocentrum_minimum.AAC.3